MPRLLTIVPAEVAAVMVPRYLDTISRLADRLERRGQHLWVFESSSAPGRFVEFAEGPRQDQHWSSGPQGAEESELAKELQLCASYPEEAPEFWREVGPHPAEGV
jgi:hypothetical protein